MNMEARTVIRAWSAVGIAGAVLIGFYSCAWAQESGQPVHEWTDDLGKQVELWHIESWKISKGTDPISDVEIITAGLFDAQSQEKFKDYREKVKNYGISPSTWEPTLNQMIEASKVLIFRCRGEELSAFVKWGTAQLKGTGDKRAIIFRFDTLQPQIRIWNISDNWTFPPDVLAFARQVMAHERLVVRTFEDQLTAVFNLEGAREVVTRIVRVCNVSEDILNK